LSPADKVVRLTGDLVGPAGQPAFGREALERLLRSAPAVLSFVRPGVTMLSPEDVAGADVLVHFSGHRLSTATMAGADRLALVARLGVGLDQLDLPACTEHGVMVWVARQQFQAPMAHGALAMVLALAHRLPDKDSLARSGTWGERLSVTGPGVIGRALGIIELGNIGGELGRLADALGMTVLAYGPRLRSEEAPPWAEVMSLEDLLQRSAFVCVCCPLTDETRGLLSRGRLVLMRPGSYLVNVARGGVVDEAALADLLARGHLAGAALDVFAQEPPAPGNPLLSMANVLLSPHSIGYTEALFDSMMAGACEAALKNLVLSRDKPRALWPTPRCCLPPACGPSLPGGDGKQPYRAGSPLGGWCLSRS
jgi:phosphoglycerate dehydrogenase-like enzyme